MSSTGSSVADPTVTFLTSDNQTKEVSWHIFKRFGLFSPQDDPETRPREAVPLPKVDAAVLEKEDLALKTPGHVQVIEYCEHHRNDPWPALQDSGPSTNFGDSTKRQVSEISDWDQEFFRVERKMLFEIIIAANYLDIKPLVELGTKTVTNMMKGMAPMEMMKLFNVVNDFTPEEEAQIKRENGWEEDRPW